MPTSFRSVIPVWAAVLVGTVVVVLVAPASAFTWLPVVMAGAILATFLIQLAVSRKEGLVERIIVSLAGALAILVVATLIVWLTTLH